MFVKLISSTSDSEKTGYVHPSYGEIITQLSSLDAQNLQIIYEAGSAPIADMYIRHSNKAKTFRNNFYYPIFIANREEQDLCKQAASINNLCRLSLVKLVEGAMIAENDDAHIQFLQSDAVSEYRKVLNNEFLSCNGDKIKDAEGEGRFGYVHLTPLGENFSQVCIG